MKLNIAWLYPDTLNLHGDRGNVMALERVAKMLDMEAEITRVDSYEQLIDFENTDIILMNPGEVRAVERLVDALGKQKDALYKYIEDDKVLLTIGTTGASFGKELVYEDGRKFACLGLLDMVATERKMVYGNDIWYKLDAKPSMEIIGSQIKLLDTKVAKEQALGKIVYGYGNCEDGTEGARYKNLIYTDALGPVLVKNPWFAEYLIRIAMENKGCPVDAASPEYKLEKDSNESIKAFTAKKLAKKEA
ncbi:MAG: hypothetical protein Q4D54_05075 [Eubacteriales bacterium]|nr:hypothetical protein [Lachnospiraceae bacterium]MDO5127105.1 hypothetical protein [Eubacteriales bacterium]